MPKANAQQAAGETRERLVAAAQHVIAEHGWSGVTTRRVAVQAGVNAGLVHYHFDSVAALRRAAVVAALQVAGAAAEPPSGDASVESLAQMMAGWLHLQDQHPQSAAVLLHGSLACLHDDLLREEVGAMLRRFRGDLAGWLVARGHDEDRAGQLSALISAALDGVLLHHLIDPAADPADVMAPLLSLAANPPATDRSIDAPGAAEAPTTAPGSTDEPPTKEAR